MGEWLNWSEDIDEMIQQFENMPPGTLLETNLGVLLKPVQSRSHHLDHMLVSLEDGSLRHFSKTTRFRELSNSKRLLLFKRS